MVPLDRCVTSCLARLLFLIMIRLLAIAYQSHHAAQLPQTFILAHRRKSIIAKLDTPN